MAETFVCSVIIIRSPEKLAERPLHWHTTECCTMTVSFNLSMISLKQILRRTAMWRSSSLSRKRIETAMATMPADALNELETIVEGIIALYRRQ